MTADESWVCQNTPELKLGRVGWERPAPPRSKNLNIVKSAVKVMATVFWGHEVVLLVDFMQQGRTVHAGAFCTTLLLLRVAIK